MFTRAIVRPPGPDFTKGLTTATHLGPPDLALALKQHAAYCSLLEEAGLLVKHMDPAPGLADAPFIEDTAVVFAEAAVITRPGALSRRKEIESVAPVLACYRNLEYIEEPGTLDGGDVLQVGKKFFVGVSERTNEAGAEQFSRIARWHGYQTVIVHAGAGLHLKSSVNSLSPTRLLLTDEMSEIDAFAEYEQIIIQTDEAYAANSLMINGLCITPAGCPNTLERLRSLDLKVKELDVSEFRKLDGGLTCLSLRF